MINNGGLDVVIYTRCTQDKYSSALTKTLSSHSEPKPSLAATHR